MDIGPNENPYLNFNDNSNMKNQKDEEAAPIMPLNYNQISYTYKNLSKNEKNYYINKNENDFIPLNKTSDGTNNDIHNDNNNNHISSYKLKNFDENNKQYFNNKENKSNLLSNDKNYNGKEEKIYTNNPDITKDGNNDLSENKNNSNDFQYSKFNLNDLSKIKEKATEMYEKGYIPLFLRMYNNEPAFYYIKLKKNLKHLLEAHLKLIGIYNPEDKYTLINNGNILDQNTPIENLDINILSIINIIKD